MNVRDYMKSPVFAVTPDTLMDNAMETMRDKHVRRLPVVEDGKIVDVRIEFPMDYVKQMLRYGKEYSFL